MTRDDLRFLCLFEELETAHKLIRAGFGSLQEIDMANDFYHLPHQLIASGLERLMKCYISLIHEDREGAFPKKKYMTALGHKLERLLQEICSKFYGGINRPLVQAELAYLNADNTLKECVRILSQFGEKGRYYNLDVVAGVSNASIDPKREWKKLEMSIEDPVNFIGNPEGLHRDYFPRVHSKLISKIERLVRAIALQFTVGDHPDKFRHLRQTSVIFDDFRNLGDDELGSVDYRQSVRILNQKKEHWINRTENEILEGRWPTKVITKMEFGDRWPFRVDRVVIELQEGLFALANIEGYAFALNGAAASRFHIPNPHAAGLALLGKSVGPFIDLAFSLRNDQGT